MRYRELPENASEMRLSPYRKDFSYSYVFGIFPVIELAENLPSALFRIILSTRISEEGLRLIRAKAAGAGAAVTFDDRTVERLSPKENCFAIGVFSKFESSPDKAADHIVLVNPSDKGNAGNIIRTAAAFGFSDVAVIRPAADVFDPHSVRASMGALFRIRPSFFNTFEEYASASGDRNYYPFMLNGSPMENTVPDRSLPCSLIFGNESAGLDKAFETIGRPVRITHTDAVDSLNLTVAAGIGMHWWRHCRPESVNAEEEAWITK